MREHPGRVERGAAEEYGGGEPKVKAQAPVATGTSAGSKGTRSTNVNRLLVPTTRSHGTNGIAEDDGKKAEGVGAASNWMVEGVVQGLVEQSERSPTQLGVDSVVTGDGWLSQTQDGRRQVSSCSAAEGSSRTWEGWTGQWRGVRAQCGGQVRQCPSPASQ